MIYSPIEGFEHMPDRSIRITPTDDIGTLCSKACFTPVDQTILVYNIPELIATVNFFGTISRNPSLLAHLPDNPYIGDHHVGEAMESYGRSRNLLEVPKEEKDFFELLKSEKRLTNAYAKDPRPRTAEELKERLEQTLVASRYLRIKTCSAHLEHTIELAANSQWVQRAGRKTGYNFIAVEKQEWPKNDEQHYLHSTSQVNDKTKEVADNSLIWAPGRQDGDQVILSYFMDRRILEEALELAAFFMEMSAQYNMDKLGGKEI